MSELRAIDPPEEVPEEEEGEIEFDPDDDDIWENEFDEEDAKAEEIEEVPFTPYQSPE